MKKYPYLESIEIDQRPLTAERVTAAIAEFVRMMRDREGQAPEPVLLLPAWKYREYVEAGLIQHDPAYDWALTAEKPRF